MSDKFSNERKLNTTPPKNSILSVFFQLSFKNWYWILLSIVLFGGWGAYKYLQAGLPFNTYFTAVMARFPEGIVRQAGSSISNKAYLHDNYTPRWEGITAFDREMTFNGLCATELVEAVGAKIQYDVNYYRKGRFFCQDIYDTTPIHCLFPEGTEDDTFEAELLVEDDKATILSLNGFHGGMPIDLNNISVPYDESVETPFGMLHIAKTESFDHAKEVYPWPMKVKVSKMSRVTARVIYDSALRTEEERSRIEMRISMNRSMGFARDFLDGLIQEYDRRARALYRDQIEEKIVFIERALANLEQESKLPSDSSWAVLGISPLEKNVSQDALRIRLLSILDEYKVDLLGAETSSSLIVLDKTKIVPGVNSNTYTLVVYLLAGIIIPLLIIIFYILLHRFLLSYSELGEKVRGRFLCQLNGGRRKSGMLQRDIDLLRLNLHESGLEGRTKCIALSGMSGGEKTEMVAKMLADSFRKSGQAMEIVHVADSEDKTVVAETFKKIETLHQSGTSVLLLTPAIAHSALSVEVSVFSDISLLLVESMCSKRDHIDGAEIFVDQSRCPAYLLWLTKY